MQKDYTQKNKGNKDIEAEPGKAFIFRLRDGKEVGRAQNMNGFESLVRVLPIESLEYHIGGKHFSAWLKYMKQETLARAFDGISSKGELLRRDLVDAIKKYRV